MTKKKRVPIAEGSYFVWVRGNTKWEPQIWAELNYGVDSRLMKNHTVVPSGTHKLQPQHLTMTIEELSQAFPPPPFNRDLELEE